MSGPTVWDKLGVMLSGEDQPWTAQGLAGLLARLQAGFLAPVDAMQLELDGPWKPIDAAAIERNWTRRKNAVVSLRTPPESGIEVHPNRHGALTFYVRPERVRALGPDAILEAARSLAGAIPGFRYAFATALGDLPDLWRAQGWPRLPRCFDAFLQWWQALHPERYRACYTREALLAAPAQVREWADGTIELRAFDDPFVWDAPQSLASLGELVRYLDARRLPPQR